MIAYLRPDTVSTSAATVGGASNAGGPTTTVGGDTDNPIINHQCKK